MSNLNEQTTIRGNLPSNSSFVDVKKKGFYSRVGFQYPIPSTSKGYFSKNSGTALIKSNLTQLLLTEPGERLMLPDYGCPLKAFLFAPLDEETFFLMKEQILLSISKYLPTVKVIRIAVYAQEEYGKSGIPSLNIFLSCKLLDNTDSSFEVNVEL